MKKVRFFKSKIRSASRHNQRGLALADYALAAILIAMAIAAGMTIYAKSKSGISAGDMAEKASLLQADISQNWRGIGSFSTVSPTEVNKLSLIRTPMKFDGTNMFDAWGNQMTLSGNATSYSFTIGGSTAPMSQDECGIVVARLQAMAIAVRIGSDAASAGGNISGGNVYKSGGTITQSGLTDGCSSTNPIIAVQFRG